MKKLNIKVLSLFVAAAGMFASCSQEEITKAEIDAKNYPNTEVAISDLQIKDISAKGVTASFTVDGYTTGVLSMGVTYATSADFSGAQVVEYTDSVAGNVISVVLNLESDTEYFAKAFIYQRGSSAETEAVSFKTAQAYVSLGKGQFFDSFAMYSVAEVEVEYSEIFNSYRISNPYSQAILEEAEWTGWIGGATQDKIEYSRNVTDSITYISWNTSWYLGLLYEGGAGAEIKAYYPSALDASLASSDLESYEHPAYEGLIVLTPYMYIDGLGGFGLKPCYLSLPGGPDLNALLFGN